MTQRVERALNFLPKTKSAASLSGEGKSNSSSCNNLYREYPTSSDQYELLEECGRGVSAKVWRAMCKPLDEEVAVKLLDLESINCSLDEIIREAQTLRQLLHPNVVPLYASFLDKQNLWLVMPYVSGGSVLSIMKHAHPEGLEEPAIATILKEVLKGLHYLHAQGFIHRDIKAGNILLDKDGQVYLADFGVSAVMERTGSWGNVPRNTFVGTPCWMAPEVMEQSGYNNLADIWSFGITILELAHGHAPFAKLPPMKVLLTTIQNPPPTLDSDSGKKHFSKAMRDIAAKCLVKNPGQRPTASQLLEHKFFKTAHDSSYLVKHLLQGLPALPERVRNVRAGSMMDLHQVNDDIQKSQEAYVKGVGAWNFDVSAQTAVTSESEDGRPDLERLSLEPVATNGLNRAALPPLPPMHPTLAPNNSSTSLTSTAPATAALPPPVPQPTPLPSTPALVPAASAPPLMSGSLPPVPPVRTTCATSTTTRTAADLPPPTPVIAAVLKSASPSTAARNLPAEKTATPKDKLKATRSVHKGRFEVWEGDDAPSGDEKERPKPVEVKLTRNSGSDNNMAGSNPSAEVKATSTDASCEAALPPLMSSGSGLSTRSCADPLDPNNPEKAKRKGRFHIVEDTADLDNSKRAPTRTTSTSSMTEREAGVKKAGEGVGAGDLPTALPMTLLLPPLKELQDTMGSHMELLKELVMAVSEAERGQHAHLHIFLAERSAIKKQKEDGEKLKAEAQSLREENSKLRERVRHLEEELKMKDENLKLKERILQLEGQVAPKATSRASDSGTGS